jgi:predicted CXXCH cytochrome family protein
MSVGRFSLIGLLVCAVGLLFGEAALADITTTKHNLSTSGPGTYRATAEQRICLMCHTPHNSEPEAPLWNHTLSGETYTPYSSSTLIAAPGQPTGKSKLCLSCHDGTIALGSIHNMPWAEGGGSGVIVGLEDPLSGSAVLATDLTDDHPVSFVYDSALASDNGELAAPAGLTGTVRLEDGEVQCTSCHDPHSSTYAKFMRLDTVDGSGYGSPLCLTCHTKTNWELSSHRTSIAEWNGSDSNPWHLEGHNVANDADSTPMKNGCESCHKPHAGGGKRLLKGDPRFVGGDGEQGVCLPCHGGSSLGLYANVVLPTDSTSTWNVESALNKTYAHPVLTTDGLHNPERDATDTTKVRESATNLGTNRHAECQDCHNPHQASAGTSPNLGTPASPNDLSNAASNVLKGVWGVTPSWPAEWSDVTSYTETDDITYQYELCFKCHSYYAFGLSPPEEPNGYYATWYGAESTLTDQAKEFNPNNTSYHPVVAAGKNDFKMTVSGTEYDYSSSLIGGVTPNSTMGCADCHSDSTPEVAAIKGPHGTDVWPILWGPYDQTTGSSGTENHLCYKCHDPAVYGYSASTSNWQRTGFSNGTWGSPKNLHSRHINVRNLACIACHAGIPHGWKRRSLLVYGTGTPDPEPYNARARYKLGDPATSVYGINSAMTLDEATYPSGNWQKNDCHGYAMGPAC